MPKPLKVDFQALIKNDVAPALVPRATPTVRPTSENPVEQSAMQIAPETPAPVVARPSRGTLKERTRQQSVYLEIPVHEVLREIAFTERTSLHALVLEGVDAVLKKRGSPSIKELTAPKPKPVL